MGTQIYFSHDSTALAERLAVDLVGAARNGPDPFTPLTVLIPNTGVKRWLQITLSESLGVTANVQFSTLERGLAEILVQRHRGSERVELLQGERMRLFVLSAIMHNVGMDNELGNALDALAFMLYDDQHEPSLNFANKLWRISGQLGRLLTEYELHRVDMVAGWRKAEPIQTFAKESTEICEMERCQMALYRHIFGTRGVRDQFAESTGTRLLTLPQLADEADLEWIGSTPIFVFGLSQVSAFHRDLLFRLGGGFELGIYQLNVCSEFWEDMTSSREDKWLKLKALDAVVTDDGGLELPWDDEENMLLKWWGKPGRENVRLLSDLENMSANELSMETTWLDTPGPEPNDSVLSSLRHQVLHRTQVDGSARTQDRSVQVFGAPEIFREVEAIHQSIMHTLSADPELKQTDVAIFVPDVTVYKPVIRAVFERGSRPLGYNLTDSTAAEESLFGAALMALLELPEREFTRKSVFELIKNPCFMAGAGISRDDVRVWVEWADRLRIFRGFDSGRDGNPRYTWQQGLKRLRLGRLMKEPTPRSGAPKHYQDLIPHHDLDSADSSAVGAFSLAIEGIYAATKRLSECTRTVAEWRVVLESLSRCFFAIPDGRPEEAAVQSKLFSELKRYEALDTLSSGDEQGVGLDLLRELLATCLQGIPSRHGSFLSGGVTIAQIKPNRVIPFEVVYFAGLGEGQFPGRAELSSLDMRQTARRLGDVSRPEEDRFAVLETIMNCQRKLYLSYVSRDLQKDQDFYPCSVIVQLIHFLETSVLDSEFRTAIVPVSGDDDRYLNDLSDDEPWDVLVNVNAHDRLLCLKRLSEREPDRFSSDDLDRVRTWMSESGFGVDKVALPTGEEAADDSVTNLHVMDLGRYMDNPLDASLRRELRINQWGWFEDEPTMKEDEPFYSENSVARELIVTVLNAVLDRAVEGGGESMDSSTFEELFDQAYDDLYRRSATPEGIFSVIDRADVLDRAKAVFFGGKKPCLHDVLSTLETADYMGAVALGDGRADMTIAPCRLTLDDGRIVDLSGILRRVWFDKVEETLHLIHLTGDRGDHQDFPLHSKLMTPFISYLAVLSQSARSDDLPFDSDHLKTVIHWTNLKGTQSVRYAPTVATAEDYLKRLCADMLDRPFDMLPYAVAASLARTNTEIPIPLRPGSYAEATDKSNYHRRFEREIREQINNPWSSWHPTHLLKLLDYSVPADAWDVINNRLSLFHACSR